MTSTRKSDMATLEDIEGIGPAQAEKLRAAGVRSVEALLASGGRAAGRTELANATGISGAQILRWVNHADLCRLNGVGPEFAELLEAAGVDSVPELAHRDPERLAAALAAANEARRRVRRVPGTETVAAWIAEAKTLERAVHH